MNNNRLSELINRYCKGLLTDLELKELAGLLEQAPDDEVSPLLEDIWNNQKGEVFFENTTREKMLSRLVPAEDSAEKVVSISGSKRLFVKLAAAAVILLLLGAGVFFLLGGKDNKIAQAEHKKVLVNDIAPGGDRAVLTLADGRQIILDSAANGAVTEQGGMKIVKLNGQLAYNQESGTTEVLYNTVSTPKGGQYQLVLADGSKVWLNAASSLRFPTAFKGADRTVELSGEGYFEVSHDAAKPFHVKVNNMDVKVLGTHFNINGYNDEPTIKTTLLEGKVIVTEGNKYVNLNPGQQAVVNEGQNIRIVHNVDLDAVVAWKNGQIYFEGADVAEIMKQISRWYNVDAGYNGNPQLAHLSGKVSRNLNLSEVIKVLEESGIVVKMENRKLIAIPKS